MSDTPTRSVSRRRFVESVGAATVVGGLAGCIGEEDPEAEEELEEAPDDATIVQWHGGPGDGDADEVKDAMREALWDAGLDDDIWVAIVDSPETTDEVLDQYSTWLGAGQETPDMLSMDTGWTVPFIERNQLENLSELLPDELISEVEDEYFEASVQAASDLDGNIFGIPEYPDFPSMLYRIDLIEEAGYDPEGEDWVTESLSWQEFAEIAVDVWEQNDDVEYAYTFQADNYEGLSCCNFNEFMTSWGGAFFGGRENLFGPVGDRPITVEEEPVLDSIRMIRTFLYGQDDEHALEDFEGDFVDTNVLGWVEDTSLSPFLGGNAIFHRNWPYAIGLAREELDGEFAVMPIPYGVTEEEAEAEGTGGSVGALGGWNMAVNPNSEMKDAVVEVIEAAMSEDFMIARFQQPELVDIPPKPDVLVSDEARDTEGIGDWVDALESIGENAIPRPVTRVWPDQTGPVASEVHAAYQGDKSPEQAMSDLAETLEAIEQDAAD